MVIVFGQQLQVFAVKTAIYFKSFFKNIFIFFIILVKRQIQMLFMIDNIFYICYGIVIKFDLL